MIRRLILLPGRVIVSERKGDFSCKFERSGLISERQCFILLRWTNTEMWLQKNDSRVPAAQCQHDSNRSDICEKTCFGSLYFNIDGA